MLSGVNMEIQKNIKKQKLSIDERGRIFLISGDIECIARKIIRREIAADPAGGLCINVYKCP